MSSSDIFYPNLYIYICSWVNFFSVTFCILG
ncbi:hypothetical protein FIM1_3117 [Kluyveromyces marxianus]|uniref:Uncharacterized protein n=1 Tax=Kluyveromyces marxianus TaxID=4911 RepID=A0ABX6EXE0_KLUMA|nr:hypothetical protein FIM1_3117 [Kluyveromyces marxianus]